MDESPRVCFAAAKEQRIKPNIRQLISINVDPAEAHKLSEERESVELVPSSEDHLPQDIKVVPCLNYLSATFQTKVMVENCGDKEYTFGKGDVICCSWASSYAQVNEEPEAITSMWIGPAEDHEINSVELTDDQQKHQASIQSDACLLYTSPSPRDS